MWGMRVGINSLFPHGNIKNCKGQASKNGWEILMKDSIRTASGAEMSTYLHLVEWL